MNQGTVLKVAFLLRADSPSTRLSIESICALPGIKPLAALVDTHQSSFYERLRNVARKIRRHGWKYTFLQILAALRDYTDRMVERAASSPEDVRRVLHEAFPGRCFSIADLARKYGFEVHEVGDLNGPLAVQTLRESHADLGIVLGTRLLREHIFSVPRLGCINLHKGKVPEYRGMPPGFWELYDGVTSAGVTVHFVDKGLDTGDIIATSDVPVAPNETPDSLRRKLDEEGARLLACAVESLRDGAAVRRKQASSSLKARTQPTPAQVRELRAKLPFWRNRSDFEIVKKNLYCLAVYYSGLYAVVRLFHRLQPRASILLYHRVNDYSSDVLTVDTETFAAQLVALSKRYTPIATAELVRRIRTGERIRSAAVAIHFDDCYQDVVSNGGPILKAAGYSATAFVSSGYVDTERPFPHDRQKYPFRYPNMSTRDMRSWIAEGFEIGAHTVNHVDLGKCTLEDARFEVVDSRAQLEMILSGNGCAPGRVQYFSFPYGSVTNIRAEVVSIIREAGYGALFSAYGGFIGPKTDLFDIPRNGCSGENRVLYLLLEMEGLAPSQIWS